MNARARLEAQEPVEPRLAQCSAVIDNSGSREETLAQVKDQFRIFLGPGEQAGTRTRESQSLVRGHIASSAFCATAHGRER